MVFLDRYHKLRMREVELMTELRSVVNSISEMERQMHIVTSLNGVIPVSQFQRDEKLVATTPTKFAVILANWIVKKIGQGVLEYRDTSALLRTWSDEERFHQTVHFKFSGDQTEFIMSALRELKKALKDRGVSWEASGRNVFHKGDMARRNLVPLLKEVVQSS